MKVRANFKKLIQKIIGVCVSLLPLNKFWSYLTDYFVQANLSRKKSIVHSRSGVSLYLYTPNRVSKYRANTFSSKEPETLDWIDKIQEGAVFWDIGANVGLYSIYAAMRPEVQVVAFEPSVFNLEWLARNIYLNNLQKRISIVPIALSDKCGFSSFRMSNTHWAGALSTFGEKFDQNGNHFQAVFEYCTVGLNLDVAEDIFSLKKPTHLKIDVDGLEHFILRGGGKSLQQVQQVLIEINDAFTNQAEESSMHLSKAGLRLVDKYSLGVPYQYNQFWCR